MLRDGIHISTAPYFGDTVASECWIPVAEYQGLYAVSDLGRVMSCIARRQSKVGDYILSPSVAKSSQYPHVNLYGKERRKSFRVADLVMASFVGPKPLGMEINHKDGNKKNSAFVNLEYVTRLQNMVHAYASGLRRPNPSGFTGVSRSLSRWIARITIKNTSVNLGTFFTAEEAARAYDHAAIKYRDQKDVWLNFPQEHANA